jgi:hypothetical protein
MQCTYKRKTRVRITIFAAEREINIKRYECVSVALVIQHAKLSPVACLAVPCFSTLSHKRHDFRWGGNIKNKMCGSIFSTIFVRSIIINVHMSLRKLPVTLVKCYWNFNFLDRFSKHIQTENFMKILPGGTELFHANGNTGNRTDSQTDRQEEANSRFSQFCEDA